MSKKEKSIELLNKAVNDELLAVHQYMYFHFRCDDMGFDLVSNLFKRIAIQDECAANADSVSKKLFETLTAEEEVHQDQFETELDNLEKFGDHYLALQSIERSKSVATGTPAE